MTSVKTTYFLLLQPENRENSRALAERKKKQMEDLQKPMSSYRLHGGVRFRLLGDVVPNKASGYTFSELIYREEC
jgi:hypothetical protein